MKVNVGDYVITNDRLHIGKIYNINDFREPSMMYAIDFPNADDFIFMGENDFKSSPNIIELLEKFDLVVDNYGNIYVVDNVFSNYVYTTTKQRDITKTLCDYQIKKVITKEEFSSIGYEVN